MIGTALLSLAIFATLGGFFLGWTLAIAYRLWSGQPSPFAPQQGEPWNAGDILTEGCFRLWTGQFLPWTPRRHVPWMWVDMAVVGLPVLLVIVLSMLGEASAKKGNAPPIRLEQYQLAVLLDMGLKGVYVALGTLYLMVRAKATLRDLGLSWRDFGQNVLIGIAAFPMIAVPVYLLQALFVYGGWTYEHPLIEMLQKRPDFGLFLPLGLSACVVAPLSEEWFFRAVLQGWLERFFAWVKVRLDAERPPLAQYDANVETPVGAIGAYPMDVAPVPAGVAALAPALEPSPSAPAVEKAHEEPLHRVLVHWVPILLSSVAFGLAHFEHGPAPVTLTVLALALGYIYQRTHSIVPVIVIHALFNSFSMLLFYVFMFELHKPLP